MGFDPLSARGFWPFYVNYLHVVFTAHTAFQVPSFDILAYSNCGLPFCARRFSFTLVVRNPHPHVCHKGVVVQKRVVPRGHSWLWVSCGLPLHFFALLLYCRVVLDLLYIFGGKMFRVRLLQYCDLFENL